MLEVGWVGKLALETFLLLTECAGFLTQDLVKLEDFVWSAVICEHGCGGSLRLKLFEVAADEEVLLKHLLVPVAVGARLVAQLLEDVEDFFLLEVLEGLESHKV